MLEVSDLDAFYGDAHILYGINIKVKPGERVAILGRNGAGKSTFLKTVMNAGPRFSGEIRFDSNLLGNMPTYHRARLGMALVPEDRRIFNHLTVLENVAMARYAARARQASDAQEIINRFAMLQPLVKRYGGQLSGGQQQLLAVARALGASPRLFLLDEPTEGLAPVIVEQMAKEIVASCDEYGIGLILCEQNIWFARSCTSRVYLIDAGSIVFSGDWQSFDENAELKLKYLAV
jgi:branched-chain amino acid transport system ATP-binding protein